jgi:pimeloyl-ACP methyl ester carboxylesterase
VDHGGRMRRREFITVLGGAVTWPLAARAQQPERMRRIGVLLPGTSDDAEYQARQGAFLQALHQLGWSHGRNVLIDTRWAAGDANLIHKYAAELIALAPDVILTGGSATLGPVLQATRTVPIVFVTILDPVGAGFVDSLARCNTAMIDDEKVSQKPIRLYHGVADDWMPIGPCRDYVARLKKVGANIDVVEYPGAYHLFDNQAIAGTVRNAQAPTEFRKCRFEERPQGVIINSDTGQPASLNDLCIERGTTMAYNAEATEAAREDVVEFLSNLLKK